MALRAMPRDAYCSRHAYQVHEATMCVLSINIGDCGALKSVMGGWQIADQVPPQMYA